MNESLREQHLKGITDETATALYDSLCTEFEKQYGAINGSAQHIIGDIAMMEQNKRKLYDDVRRRGVIVTVKNGRQEFTQQNKSIAAARGLAEQQRKLLNELKLTPASQKADASALEDDFESF